MGTAARNIVLVGDQMQLGQPVPGVIPATPDCRSSTSCWATRPPSAPNGDFPRPHAPPPSDRLPFYLRSVLRWSADTRRRQRQAGIDIQVAVDGITPEGIHFLPVDHRLLAEKRAGGRANQRPLPAAATAGIPGQRRQRSSHDDGRYSGRKPVQCTGQPSEGDFASRGRVGTVDKFQGQEAPAVLVSMATSAPRTCRVTSSFCSAPTA